MLNIPATVKTLFMTDGVRKNFRAHFPNGEFSDITNADVVSESVKFTESLCSQSVFKFGLAEASVLEFESVGVGNMYGMSIEAGIEVDISSLSAAQISAIEAGTWDGTLVKAADSDIGYGFFRVPLGLFRVESCPRDHQNMAHRQVTAYSAAVKTPRLTFPQRMVWPTIYAKAAAIRGAALGGLPVASTATFTRADANDYPVGLQLCDSGGICGIEILDADASDAQMEFGSSGGGVLCSVNMPDYKASAYDAFGVAVAEALTNAGCDLTYDANGNHRFTDNEAALRTAIPWLFGPCMPYSFRDKAENFGYTMAVQSVSHNELFPFIHSTTEAAGMTATETGFRVEDTEYTLLNLYPQRVVWALVKPTGNNVKIVFHPSSGTDVIINAQLEGYLTAAPTITHYNLASSDGEITINNTGANTFYYGDGTGAAFNYTVKEKTGYNYEIPSDRIIALYSGAAELEAKFIKADRNGGFEAVRLDNTSPVSIVAGNYAECWWDEYNVEPIGSVIVTYQSAEEGAQENTTSVSIGSGLSEYDMSGNEMLKALNSASLADVTALINSSFAPHAGAVAFTPAELVMQGWPWIEAGDALQITAEDGTIVDTYALRVEMSGIQYLTATITAEGGEIVEEG